MNLGFLFGWLSGAVHILGYGFYLREVKGGGSLPNAVSWMIWTAVSVLNSVSYIVMTGDWVKGILPVVSSIACVTVLAGVLRQKSIFKMNRWDASAGAMGVVAVAAWWISRSATWGNLLLQVCSVIAFIPTYRGAIRRRSAEKPIAWFVWSASYLLVLAAVILRWSGQYQDLVYPITDTLLHGGVGIIASRKQ